MANSHVCAHDRDISKYAHNVASHTVQLFPLPSGSRSVGQLAPLNHVLEGASIIAMLLVSIKEATRAIALVAGMAAP